MNAELFDELVASVKEGAEILKNRRNYKVCYGIPTYTQFADCRKAIEAIIHNSTLVPDEIIIVDNSEKAAAYDALYDLTIAYPQVSIWIRDENVLSGAWNDLMRYDAVKDHIDEQYDWYTLIANDDVVPHKHTIQTMVDAARQQPDIAMFNGAADSGNSYSFFLLRTWAYARVGEFDTNFKPAYFEDNDYDWRLKCAGLIRETVTTATFDHVGSATMKGMTDERRVGHHAAFVRNQRYYMRKWGAAPPNEKYKTPFERPFVFNLEDL